MTVRIINATILDSVGGEKPGELYFDSETGIITDVVYDGSEKCCDSVIDADGLMLSPGLIDVHTHGRAGNDFNFADVEDLTEMSRSYLASGVTSVMPTLASAEFEALKASSQKIKSFSPPIDGADFVGTHLEGRYINPQKRGAHNEKLIFPPNADEIRELAENMRSPIHISSAYELDTDGTFAAAALECGATLGLAHTNATYAEAKLAEERGVTSYTHVFNAMPPLHHRNGGAVCAALTGKCFCELICDGIHVRAEMVALAYRLVGKERFVLITDSMEATGCPDGEYTIAGLPVTVKNSIAYTNEGALAGSTLSLFDAVKNLSDFCGIPLSEALVSATANPAKMINVYDRIGSLEVGKVADILFIDKNEREIRKIIHNGKMITEGKSFA